jgi:hypothetical protein
MGGHAREMPELSTNQLKQERTFPRESIRRTFHNILVVRIEKQSRLEAKRIGHVQSGEGSKP